MNISKVILLLAVTASAMWDFVYLKIPNKLLIITALAGTATCFFESNSLVFSLISYVGRAAFIILILEPFSRMRMIGAGDVKLFSVMCAYLGIRQFVRCFIWTVFFAGIVSVVKLIKNRNIVGKVKDALGFISASFKLKKSFKYESERKSMIPLSVCTLLGYLTFLISS